MPKEQRRNLTFILYEQDDDWLDDYSVEQVRYSIY